MSRCANTGPQTPLLTPNMAPIGAAIVLARVCSAAITGGAPPLGLKVLLLSCP
jgi:hypothetical protein